MGVYYIDDLPTRKEKMMGMVFVMAIKTNLLREGRFSVQLLL